MKGNVYWQRNSILKILKNEVYIGNVVSGITRKVSHKVRKCERVPKDEWIIVPNKHEPIISKEDFDKVQYLMKKRTGIRKRKHDHVLKGLLTCGKCGSLMTIKPDSRGNNVKINFICSAKNANRSNCDNSSISGDIAYNAIVQSLKKEFSKIILSKEEIERLCSEIEKEKNIENSSINDKLNKLRNKVKNIDKQISIIYEDRLNGILTTQDFTKIHNTKKEEQQKYIDEIKSLGYELQEQNKKETIDYKKLCKFAEDFLKMEKPTKEMIERLVDKIEINKGRNIKIKYKFFQYK